MYVAAARPLALAFACWPPRPLFKGGTNRRDPWGPLAPARGGGPGAPGGACIPGASSGSRLTVVCLLHLMRDKTEAQTNRADCPEPSAARRAGAAQPRGAPAQQAGPEHGGRMSVTVTVAVEVGLGVEGGRLAARLLLPADSRRQTEGGAQAASAARGTALRPRPSPPSPAPRAVPGGPAWGRQTELGHLCGQVARPSRDWPDQECALESF